MEPWGVQKSNDRIDLPVPSVNRLAEVVGAIVSAEERALVGLVYLTGGRISELIQSNRYGRHMDSIKRSQIDLETYDGHNIVKITIRNLKKRKDKNAFKIIPIPLDITSNRVMFDLIWPYIKEKSGEEELFPYGYTKAMKIINKTTGWNPHWIRHIRTNHLLVHFDFKEEQVRLHMGWTDLRPMTKYAGTRWTDIVKGYYKK